jgi:tripartite-type tricarboxylate transporter receptor subunit TctC
MHGSFLRSMAMPTAVLVLAAAPVAAQEPAIPKQVRIVAASAGGTGPDFIARLIAPKLGEGLRVSAIVENRPSANGVATTAYVAKAPPDGSVMMMGNAGTHAINAALYRKLDYDPVKDFAYVSLAAYVPQFLVVYPAVPAKGVKELIDLAKAQPGKISFGSPGVGTVGHLSLELIIAASGAKFVHVPYKGAGPAVIDLVGGRIQALFASVAGTQAQVSGGRIRAIATGHRERLRSWPDVPTVAEALPLPGFSNNGWYGIVGPAGMPAPIINKLNAEMKRALSNAEFAKHVEAIGMEPAGSTPQELRDWTRSELARWTKVVRDAGIQAPQN